MMRERIILHDSEGFEALRRAGHLAAETLDYITPFVVPGASTGKLDGLCHEFICAHKATPAPLNYRGYPKSICTSVNHVICHGIPDDNKILRQGDILNIDVTVILDGWYGDTSRMFYVGDRIPIKARRLCELTFKAMMAGIKAVKPGATVGDVGHEIQKMAEGAGFSVVRDFCGHGIGQQFHMAPNILHFGRPGEGITFEPGMFFTIEPMINVGTHQARILADNWTAVTRDKSLSAQFEHTVGVTPTGHEIFTLSPAGLQMPPYG